MAQIIRWIIIDILLPVICVYSLTLSTSYTDNVARFHQYREFILTWEYSPPGSDRFTDINIFWRSDELPTQSLCRFEYEHVTSIMAGISCTLSNNTITMYAREVPREWFNGSISCDICSQGKNYSSDPVLLFIYQPPEDADIVQTQKEESCVEFQCQSKSNSWPVPLRPVLLYSWSIVEKPSMVLGIANGHVMGTQGNTLVVCITTNKDYLRTTSVTYRCLVHEHGSKYKTNATIQFSLEENETHSAMFSVVGIMSVLAVASVVVVCVLLMQRLKGSCKNETRRTVTLNFQPGVELIDEGVRPLPETPATKYVTSGCYQ